MPTTALDTWEQLIRFHREATTTMDQHLRGTFAHSLDDYDVLHQIHDHGAPIRMGELAERLLIANSSCHRAVARLVDGGLLERHQGETDRRVISVSLTSEGKRLRRRMAAAHTRDIETAMGQSLADDELQQLGTLLGRLRESA